MQSLTLQEHLNKYESKVLLGALAQMENSVFWEVFKSFIKLRQREFEVASLDLAGHTGKQHEAAKASGYSLALEDIADGYMNQLRNLLKGETGVVNDPIPEEMVQ